MKSNWYKQLLFYTKIYLWTNTYHNILLRETKVLQSNYTIICTRIIIYVDSLVLKDWKVTITV